MPTQHLISRAAADQLRTVFPTCLGSQIRWSPYHFTLRAGKRQCSFESPLSLGSFHFDFHSPCLHCALPTTTVFLLGFIGETQAVLAEREVVGEPIPTSSAFESETHRGAARVKKVSGQRHGFTLASRHSDRLICKEA